jgi:hypothetical protein
MTTAQSIIIDGYRENNLIPVGSSPTTDEFTESLRKLNRYIDGVYGHELGEQLYDWTVPAPQRTAPVSANYPQLPYPLDAQGGLTTAPFQADPSLLIYTFPPKNSRIVWAPITGKIYFPEAPEAGTRMGFVQSSGAAIAGSGAGQILTIDGNGRTIEGANTKTLTAPATPRKWFYRDDLADWVLMADLALSDPLPFPAEYDDFWISALSISNSPSYGKVVNVATADKFKAMLTKIKTRYRQSQVTVYNAGDIPRGLQSYISGRWFYLIPSGFILTAHWLGAMLASQYS